MTRSQTAPGSGVQVVWRCHAGGARWLTFLLALAASLVFGVSAASAAPNISGTWTCCGTTSPGTTQAGAQVFAITESGSGALSGSGLTPSGSVFSTITGSVSGSTATIVTTYNMNDDPGYVATFTGTISADGSTMSGSWSSTFNGTATGQEGTWTATVASKRPSATQVICNYDVPTGTDTCGANVADAGTPPTITPTGPVNFTSNFGGTFLSDSCTLTPTPDSPGVASCTVQFLPPSTQPVIPPGGVSATYAGDAQHAGSSGATQLLGTIPTTGADNFPPSTGCTASASSAEYDAARADLLYHSANQSLCGGGVVAVGSWTALSGGYGFVGTAALAGVELTPVGWFVTGGVAVIGGLVILSKSDSVDLSYRALALPPPAPKLKPRLRACLAGARGSNCRLLQRGFSSFLTAQLQIVPSVIAEAIATNRGLNAIKAKDSAAVALQTAAEKVYYGQLAAAESTLTRSARALAQALRRTHQDETVRTANIVSGLRKLTPQLAPLMFKLLAGLNESHQTIRQQLGSIPGRVSASLISMPRVRLSQLLQLLGVHLDVAAFRRIYQSMTVENLRALVYGLARSQTISAGNANELVSDLSCSSGRPNIARFRSDASKLVPSKYAALLKFAAAPLAGATSCT